jgi:hypothetical protein
MTSQLAPVPGRVGPRDDSGVAVGAGDLVSHAATGVAPQIQRAPAGAGPLQPVPEPKEISAPLMTTLKEEHKAKRKALDADLAAAEADTAKPETIKAALGKAAKLLGIALDPAMSDVSAFDAARWTQEAVHLHTDLIGPALAADSRVAAEKLGKLDVGMVAVRLTNDGYEALFHRCGKLAAGWEVVRFTDDFLHEFTSILGVIGGAAAFTVEHMKVLFSAAQRQALSGYFKTHLVPEGLFTSAAATGAVTGPQRVLIAAHMLMHGKVQKHDADGAKQGDPEKASAVMCGAWAQKVCNYAGVNPAEGNGMTSSIAIVGPTGQTSFGGADTNPESTQFSKNLGAAAFTALQAGDWIYVEKSFSAGHSLIFVKWESGVLLKKDPGGDIQYKVARVFSQYDNDPKTEAAKGGQSHTYNLATRFSPAPLETNPVMRYTRPQADAGPPHSVAQLLRYNPATAVAANQETITKGGLSVGKLHAHLAAEAKALFAGPMFGNFEPTQKALCQQILAETTAATVEAVSELMALCERLSLREHITGKLGNDKGVLDAALVGSAAAFKADAGAGAATPK